MAFNPVKQTERLTNPIERTNPVNDPDYQHQEGYNPFSLSAPELFTARFGEVTPIKFVDTVPADRHVEHLGIFNFMDQVDSRVLSDIRAYVDYFHVPLRNIYPINYDKIIVNPTKGDDVPFMALPSIPLLDFIKHFLDNSDSDVTIRYTDSDGSENQDDINLAFITGNDSFGKQIVDQARALYVAFMLSRGQVLDHIGFCPDVLGSHQQLRQNAYLNYKNELQQAIDDYFRSFFIRDDFDGNIFYDRPLCIYGVDLSDNPDGLNSNEINIRNIVLNSSPATSTKVVYEYNVVEAGEGQYDYKFNLSAFRAALYDIMEKGLFPVFKTSNVSGQDPTIELFYNTYTSVFLDYIWDFLRIVDGTLPSDSVSDFDAFFNVGYISPSRIVAYQQSIAQYFTSDTVDNVFNSELWMQNMRALMYPSVSDVTTEPTFRYNGVDYEYDMFTTGGFRRAFWQNANGFLPRTLPFISNLFLFRRSLRYADYFASGRPNMLSVGDISVPLQQDGVSVSPVDMTKGIVFQKFFNAVNRWGMKAINYMASLFGVKPSNTGPCPAYVCQIEINMNGDTVANTSENQGKVTTNIVGDASQFAFDVFVDDFGILLGVMSYSTPAYYPSGIDRHLRNFDRFSLFNPMLQNIGDQPIRQDELSGVLDFTSETPFAYATRYAEYKNAIARCHGGFVNDMPGYSFVYPHRQFISNGDQSLRISPDFIRDCPFYLDRFKKSLTGVSPAQYYHFAIKVNNQHDSARKMAFWPGIL